MDNTKFLQSFIFVASEDVSLMAKAIFFQVHAYMCAGIMNCKINFEKNFFEPDPQQICTAKICRIASHS